MLKHFLTPPLRNPAFQHNHQQGMVLTALRRHILHIGSQGLWWCAANGTAVFVLWVLQNKGTDARACVYEGKAPHCGHIRLKTMTLFQHLSPSLSLSIIISPSANQQESNRQQASEYRPQTGFDFYFGSCSSSRHKLWGCVPPVGVSSFPAVSHQVYTDGQLCPQHWRGWLGGWSPKTGYKMAQIGQKQTGHGPKRSRGGGL